MFSSPLAECYARDKASAFKSNIGSDYISVEGDHKTVHCRQPDVRLGTHSKPKFERRSNAHAFKSSSREHSDYSNQTLGLPETSASLNRNHLRPLLSPISFTPLTDASEASDSTDSRFRDECTDLPFRKDIHNAAATSISTQDSNRCLFPACKTEIFEVEDRVGTTRAPMERLDHSSLASKPRAQSLGEGLHSKPSYDHHPQERPDNPPRHALHRTTGSRELRRSAGSQQSGRSCAPWVDQIIRSTQCAGSYQPYQATNTYGPPRHAKTRIWLDATKNEERIEEAQVTTVIHSPTRPKVITIPRRGSSGSPTKEGSTCDEIDRDTERKPATPPETPQSAVGLGIFSVTPAHHSKGNVFVHSSQDQLLTPPDSRLATPRVKGNLSCKTPRREFTLQESGLTAPPKAAATRIITELEAAIYNHPSARLYLDSPIIEHIRSSCTLDVKRCGTSKTISTPRFAAPHSRYSLFKPLSSHPVTPLRHNLCYRGVEYQSKNRPPTDEASITAAKDTATLAALRVIFPHAPGALLGSLQATYLALNYITSLPSSGQPALYSSTCQPSPAPSGLMLSSIPRKALATLGIQAPVPSPAGSTSWLRSETLDTVARGVQDDEGNSETHKERMENLQVSLRICVRSLLGEIEGRRLGKRDESLVRAAGEVVRCGENVSSMSN